MRRILVLGLFWGVSCCVPSWLIAGEGVGETQRTAVCGPRCTQQILEHYGHRVELIDLVSEMQDGRVDGYCSLADIQNALAKRGVESLPVRLGVLELPAWSGPVVLNCGDRHFVVLKATNGAYAEIRDGPSPHSSWEFIPSVLLRFNRVALLTSRSPIRIEDVTLVRWPRWFAGFGCVVVGVPLGLAGGRRKLLPLWSFCLHKFRKRSQS
jgi:hypothetical protein